MTHVTESVCTLGGAEGLDPIQHDNDSLDSVLGQLDPGRIEGLNAGEDVPVSTKKLSIDLNKDLVEDNDLKHNKQSLFASPFRVPTSPGLEEARIAALEDLLGDDFGGIISETESESDNGLLVDNSVMNGVEALCDEINEEGIDDWYEEQALPLGQSLGFKELEDARLRSILCDLNLNFGKKWKAS